VTVTTGTESASATFTVTGAAAITLNPTSGQVGQTLSVAISGQNTNFVQGTTTANFGAGITVNTLTVNSPTSTTASITIQNSAIAGARTVTVATGSESAIATFMVTGAPAITLNPTTGQVGQTLSVAINGQNTNFVQGTTTANFGAGVTVNTLTVNSPASAIASITIQSSAATGARTVMVATGTESVSAMFNFTAAATPLEVVSFNVLFGAQNYNLITGGAARVRLPWQIIGIRVVFSRPVITGNANSLSGVTPTGISGLGTNTLTWTIGSLTQGNFAAVLAGSGPNALADASGIPLGGGAGYTQNFKVLFGDLDDDGAVSASDLVGVNNATTSPYNVFADINGDGAVNVSDVQVVRSRIGASLP